MIALKSEDALKFLLVSMKSLLEGYGYLFADKLVRTPLGDGVTALPSPEHYKGKILIKVTN